jgi:hypothetical protein
MTVDMTNTTCDFAYLPQQIFNTNWFTVGWIG